MPPFRTEADLANLASIREEVIARAQEARLPSGLLTKLELALEEALVNVMSYAYDDKSGMLEVECRTASRSFTVTIRDWGGPFNPLESPPPSLANDIEQRQVGGLGIMLLTTMTDHCEYRRIGDANELSFSFSLE